MSTGSTNQPSTVKSYIDTATATVQNAIGSLTGNPADKQAAADKHNHADVERSASKSGASVGPFNVAPSGVTVDNEDRTKGKKDQTVGSGKEFVGNLFGSKSLADEGKQQNAQGEGREAAGQVKDLAGGAVDRVTGAVGSGIAAAAGNKDAERSYQRQHDVGKTNVRGVEDELK